jgi:nucleotide-binding universal stress UspA family protein
MRAIKNILVPVDFSENSKAAYEFAIGLADDLNAAIKVVHILNEFNAVTPLADTLIVPASDNDFDEKLNAFLAAEESEMGAVLTKKSVKVNSEVVFGNVASSIINLSKTGEYDLVVMGITGERSFSEQLFGSTASDVSQKAACPVLLLPKNYQYTGILDMLYACDFDHTSTSQIKKVAETADFFDANVNLVFVRETFNEDKNYDDSIKEIGKVFNSYAPNVEFKAEIIDEDSVVDGVNEYCKENNVDMVVVVTKNRSFWSKFVHSSTTKQMALYAEAPVLILHEN